MDSIALFTDISLNPKLGRGVGAYLALPSSFLELSTDRLHGPAMAERLRVRRFEATTSTTLEVRTVLWALEECRREFRGPRTGKLILYSDSQCIDGLLQRRRRLEATGFLSKGTGRLLANAVLYRTFFALHDELEFEVIKVPGHTRSRSQKAVHRVFSLVDRKARKELKLWMAEREALILAGDSADGPDNENWCVYLLKCRNEQLYTGITNDLEKRLKEHERGKGSKFVRSQRPFELVKTIPCRNAGAARRLECHLKRLKREKKLEILGIEMESLKKGPPTGKK